ncbi:hypothetical protein BJ165DRAFT_1399809 [Panaeolus papilionaceus]|nr:hypothetical protein BJ165DRAFT_1399809 [Panaeolus papilionaceus]
MFGLTLNVGLMYHRALRLGRKRKSLAYILFRDSILFPILAVLICVINLITWTSLPHSAIQMSVSLAAFVPCILGCRLILNLREAYYLTFEEEAMSTNEKRRNGPLNSHEVLCSYSSSSSISSGSTILMLSTHPSDCQNGSSDYSFWNLNLVLKLADDKRRHNGNQFL